MKKLSFYTLLIIFFCCICIQPAFSFGKKESKQPEPEEWAHVAETILFGFLEKGKGGSLVLTVDHTIPGKATIRGAGKITYSISGDNEAGLRKKTGAYVLLRGKTKEIPAAQEKSSDTRILFVTKILLVQKTPTPDWKNTQPIEIEGIIELGKDNHICIVTNWESRSRVSHYVYGDHTQSIEKSPGFIVRAVGLEIVQPETEKSFTKHFLIERILSMKENGPDS